MSKGPSHAPQRYPGNAKHGNLPAKKSHTKLVAFISMLVLALALIVVMVLWNQHQQNEQLKAQASASATVSEKPSQAQTKSSENQSKNKETQSSPDPSEESLAYARQVVSGMSMEERAGQLVMASLAYGTDPSSVQELITQDHVGSVILMGNWDTGVAGVRQVTDTLQTYASQNSQLPLLIATDQEGGQVQHLQGEGFSLMPSAVEQGKMSDKDLRKNAQTWGQQLADAGVNIDLAPSVDTVTIERAANAPIGALDRDFGLDAKGDAEHAIAFIEGMRQAGVGTSPKHYPGLGSVQGNTDFTAEGITDSSTTETGEEVQAFNTVIEKANPAMVMVSLATYTQLDPDNPAAFSPRVITDMLRGSAGYHGVVISDSLSASAVSGVTPRELGVRLVEAGGDIACINDPSYALAILEGLRSQAANDSGFAQKLTDSAIRVVALKKQMGLIQD